MGNSLKNVCSWVPFHESYWANFCNITENWLQHRCFFGDFPDFFRKSFMQRTWERLFLKLDAFISSRLAISVVSYSRKLEINTNSEQTCVWEFSQAKLQSGGWQVAIAVDYSGSFLLDKQRDYSHLVSWLKAEAGRRRRRGGNGNITQRRI